MDVGGLTLVSLWCLVASRWMIFSAAAQSSNGEREDSSIPCSASLMVFKDPGDWRNPKGHFQREGGAMYKTGRAKTATTALWSASATKAV